VRNIIGAVQDEEQQIRHTTELHRLLKELTNEELWRITHQKSIQNQIKRRKWNWIGHTLRKETGAIEKTALDWNPQGYRREVGRRERGEGQ